MNHLLRPHPPINYTGAVVRSLVRVAITGALVILFLSAFFGR